MTGAAHINIVSTEAFPRHVVCERDGFAALVERSGDGLGGAGSAGLITPRGLAALIWRGENAFFVAKGFERAATLEEIVALRAFSADLEALLRDRP